MEDRFSSGKRVAVLGIALNIVLLLLKLTAGYAAGSQAMIADGFNSMGDVFASTVTLLGSIYAAKPKDADHAWGHGKAEYIASMIIGFSMVAMAIYTVSGSVESLVAGEKLEFSWWLIGVAVTTIAAKFILYCYCIRKSRNMAAYLSKRTPRIIGMMSLLPRAHLSLSFSALQAGTLWMEPSVSPFLHGLFTVGL